MLARAAMLATVDFNVNDTSLPDLEMFLDRTEAILHSTSEPWTLDCSRCQYMGPSAAVVLASIWLQTGRHRDASIRLPNSPEALRAFCSFSGLRHLIEGADPPDPAHPRSETAPLHTFSRMDWGMTTPFVNLVQRHASEVGQEEHSVLRLCVEEIAQNVEDHAQSPVGGLSCARFLAGRRDSIRARRPWHRDPGVLAPSGILFRK